MTVTVAKPDGSQKTLSDDVVNQLRTQLRGQLVASADPEALAEPRAAWNAMYVDRPAVSARCTGTADVVDAVNFAREQGLLVAVRGGGHSVAGLSTVRDGMLIDLSGMNSVQVDPTGNWPTSKAVSFSATWTGRRRPLASRPHWVGCRRRAWPG